MLTALALGGLTPSVRAAVAFVPQGTGAALPGGINGFDEAVGNALAQGASGTLTAGQEFTLYYQANITGLLSPNGSGNIIPAGLDTTADGAFNNGTFEYTVVAAFRERVVSATPTQAVFALAPNQTLPNGSPSYIKFFYDQSPASTIPPVIQPAGVAANNAAGTGFAGGTLILEATPNPAAANTSNFTVATGSSLQPLNQSGSGDYTGVQTIVGSGTTQFTANVIFANQAFFPGVVPSTLTTSFNTSQKTPFQEIAPSTMFVLGSMPGTVASEFFTAFAPTVGPINGQTQGTDFIFQADANNSFNVVPEPGSISMALTGIGLVSLGALRALRRRTA